MAIIRDFFLKHFEDIFSRGLGDIKELLIQKKEIPSPPQLAGAYPFQGKVGSMIKDYYEKILEIENDEMAFDVVSELQLKQGLLYQKDWII